MGNTQIIPQETSVVHDSNNSPYSTAPAFEHAQRVAKMLSSSSLIPAEYQNNIQNTMIALEMANRIGASPLMVMQNLYIVKGKPTWASPFIIATINACGRFSPLRFEVTGEKGTDDWGCHAYATDKVSGEKIIGTRVTWKMANVEGWVQKSGSKWQSMPEQMLQYRAATFFGRLYCPDLLMGMQSVDEVNDITESAASIYRINNANAAAAAYKRNSDVSGT